MFFHKFVLEARLHGLEPQFRARLVKKLKKFDARGGSHVPEPVPAHQTPAPEGPPAKTPAPVPAKTPSPVPRQTAPTGATSQPPPVPVPQRAPIQAPGSRRIVTPPAAGPGPTTTAYYAAVAASVATNNIRLGDLDADGDEDPDVMQGIESAVEKEIDGMDTDEDDNSPPPVEKKGKQRARTPETDESDDSGNKVVSRSKQVIRPTPRSKRVALRPSGELHDPPCPRCEYLRRICEKDFGGGACVACKRTKQRCGFAARRVKKGVKNKIEIASEDDETDHSQHPRRISGNPVPPMAVLTPPPTRPTTVIRVMQATRKIPNRPRAPPSRKARTKANQAIRDHAEGREPPRPVQPARRGVTGTQSRPAGMRESYFP